LPRISINRLIEYGSQHIERIRSKLETTTTSLRKQQQKILEKISDSVKCRRRKN